MATVIRQNRYTQLLVLLVVCTLEAGVAYSQSTSKFMNRKLEGIAASLSSLYQFNSSVPQTYVLSSLCASKPVIVTVDQFRVVNHIGLKLFDRAIVEGNPSPVYNFVERLFLELLLLKSDAEIKQYLSESKVILQAGAVLQQNMAKGLLRLLADITPDQSVFITTDNSRYAISWIRNGKPILSVRFPIQYELLWGMNKAEAENRFYSDILSFRDRSKEAEALEMPRPESLIAMGDSCYCAAGDFYAIEAVTSNRYYKQRPNGSFGQLFDIQHPIESICNLFTAETPQQIEVKVAQKMYGGRKNAFTLPLSKLVNFCRMSGCEVYVGIESQEGTHLRGMVILMNRSLGYNHLFHFDTDTRILLHPETYRMEIELYAFVPIHNINNLYNDKFINNKAE